MRRTIEELRQLSSDMVVELRGMVRRVAIGIATSDRLWQALGYEVAPGQRETFEKVKVFQGIGFSARPRAGKGEAIILNVGGRPGHPVIVATRDLETEPTDLAEDETSLHNSSAQVRFKADGTIEATDRSGGVAVQLATLADMQALTNYIQTQLTLPVSGAVAGPIATPTAPTPSGTSTFKAQ